MGTNQTISVGSKVRATKDLHFAVAPRDGTSSVSVPQGTIGVVKEIGNPQHDGIPWIHAEWNTSNEHTLNPQVHNANHDEYQLVE